MVYRLKSARGKYIVKYEPKRRAWSIRRTGTTVPRHTFKPLTTFWGIYRVNRIFNTTI